MKNIKYVVVCKKGYLFTSDKETIKEFVKKMGTDVAYYIGYFKPLENLNFLSNIDINLENLGKVIDN